MNEVAHGNFEHESEVDLTSRDEIGLLASAFNQMTASLRAGRESELENQRISGELSTAKAIHIKLMPEKLPQLPGIDIFTAYQSAKEVGGDYYDFIPVGDTDHLALCVADVSGKGIPGSMVMGTTRTILRMMAVGNLSPAEVLAKTNYHVARDIKRGMFVTCVYCILNVRTREMAVASAGHNPLLMYRAATGKLENPPQRHRAGLRQGPGLQPHHPRRTHPAGEGRPRGAVHRRRRRSDERGTRRILRRSARPLHIAVRHAPLQGVCTTADQGAGRTQGACSKGTT